MKIFTGGNNSESTKALLSSNQIILKKPTEFDIKSTQAYKR